MKKEDILKLINMGFEPRIISAEFGISEEYIGYIIEQQRRQVAIAKSKADTANMKKIRDNYRAVYCKRQKEKDTLKPLREKTDAEKRIIEDFIERLDETYGNKSELSEQEKRQLSKSFLIEYLKYQNIPLDLEELGKIHKYLFSDDLLKYYRKIGTNDGFGNKISNYGYKANRILMIKVLEQVKYLAGKAEDIDSLNKISRLIPLQTQYSIDLETAKRVVQDRIVELRKKKNALEINEVSDYMKQALKLFVSPDCDVEKIMDLLDLEVQRRQKAMPARNLFGMSQNGHRKQTLFQFTKLLDIKAREYPIQNPEKAMDALHKIDNTTDNLSKIKTITTNLANQDREQEAIEFCKTFSKARRVDGTQTELSRSIGALIKELTSKQIGKMVIRQINQGPYETGITDEEFLQILEKKMKENVIKPEQISLGLNEDGTKKIRLSDVWYDKSIKFDIQEIK